MLDAATYLVTGEPVGMAHVTGYSSEDEVRLLRTSILVADRFSNGVMSRSSSSRANAVIVNKRHLKDHLIFVAFKRVPDTFNPRLERLSLSLFTDL